MPRAARRCLCPLGLAPAALLALLSLALARGEPGVSAADTDGGGGLGSLLRRLMLDLFAWLGSLFGLRGSEVEAHDYPARGGGVGGVGGLGGRGDDEGRGGRFPPRGAGRRSTTVSPQEVERFPADGIDERGLSRGAGGEGLGEGRGRQPELQEADGADADANASPEGGIGDASIEQLGGRRGGGGGGGRGVGDASPEEFAGDRPDVPPPARVTA